MTTKIYLETLGCAKNSVDSQIMMGQMLKDGFEIIADAEQSDVMVVNTCAFITKAVNESIERVLLLAKLKKNGQPKKLIVAGCLSERYREQLLEEISEIDAVIGTSDYTAISDCISECLGNVDKVNRLEKRPLYSKTNLRTDQVLAENNLFTYLKISEGCSNMCSFCNIPKLRGPFQSRTIPEIVAEQSKILAAGTREINLISQDCSSYGLDLGDQANLVNLVRAMLDSTSEEFWLRIFYAYPNRFPNELFQMMAEDPRLTPYADIPFQHIDSSVLKAMNRKITGSEIESLIEKALEVKPDLALRSTLIVGFPNETEAAFQNLKRFVEKGYFAHLGVFTYSAEDNISSNKLGDPVSEEVKCDRRDQLMAVQQQVSLQKNRAMIGQKQKVLIEGAYEETDLLLRGRNQYQGPEVDGLVLINEGAGNPGQFQSVEIVDAHPYDLIARIV